MKKMVSFALLCMALAACRSGARNEVVKETYIHKYGVPVAKADWDAQGKEGKIIAVKKDGVTTTSSFVNGILEGETTHTFPNSSTIQKIELYRAGELISKRECYPSGVPMKEEIYEKRELVKLTRWYEDGTPSTLEAYSGKKLVSGEYRTPLNVVESRVFEGHGTRICRSSDGDLVYKDTIHDGSMAERVAYFPNGDPKSITPYESGAVNGTRLTFLQGGLPNTVEQWKEGVQEGITVVYVNGEMAAEVPYENGQKNGVERRFKDGKILVEEITWKEDVQHGPRMLYVDGDPKIEWFHQGEMVSRTAYERMNMPR